MALRTRLEAGEVDQTSVALSLANATQRLLAVRPRDAELIHVARSLAARAFSPPPPATLPRGNPEDVRRALRLRSAEELEKLAASLVVVPDAASDPDGARAALELFLRVPSEEARASALCAALEALGHDVALGRFELATRHTTSTEAVAEALRAVPAEHRATAERRAAARLLTHLGAGPDRPAGLEWIVVCRDGESVANHVLALQRRPALGVALGPIAEWMRAPDPALDAAHAADRAGDWARGSELVAQALDGEDRTRALGARAALLPSAPPVSSGVPAVAPPRSGLASRLHTLASSATPVVEMPGAPAADEPIAARFDGADAAALELVGDRRGAALLWLNLAARGAEDLTPLAQATRLASELRAPERRRLIELLRTPAVRDETLFADPGLRLRAALLHQLEPDPWAPIRLAAWAPPAAPAAAPSALPESDPHHPDNRLAAASDLLAAGKLEPAANILAALLRKVDENAPPRLFAVVAQALEADEPPPELVSAAEKALVDERRCTPLLIALGKAPTAAFALHEALIGFALDPSRSDIERLLAVEVWLAIWRATETPPDPDAMRTLRQDEPALLVAAAARLGGVPEPVTAIGRFLAQHPPATTSPEELSAALLELSLGRA